MISIAALLMWCIYALPFIAIDFMGMVSRRSTNVLRKHNKVA